MAGRMEGFSVGRSELLAWVNNTFDLNVTKVEQCANGAVYCQVIDICHPGGITMKRVNWMARANHEAIPNYKILQQAFDRCRIDKHVEVDKLVRGKYQDNLEMLQWIKTYFDKVYAGAEYDGPSRRFGDLPEWVHPKDGAPRRREQLNVSCATDTDRSYSDAMPANRDSRTSLARRPCSGGSETGRTPGGSAHQRLKEETETLKEELVDYKITVDGLEKERDFYFQKLRDIEILCQALEATPNPHLTVERFVEDVQQILYAKDDEEDGQY
mmetsp:Transcript_46298/g.84750  ORF Transcript_46298/g.84750 Transcript_46298/m.84750 type:complete len:270 (-) Transcript_46298:46-855(-)